MTTSAWFAPATKGLAMAAIPDYRLLSFDLDGTLVDAASEIAEAANGLALR